TVQTRKINGESKLDPDRPGIPHTTFLVRMNIEADAQCSGESFHFRSFDCCVVCQDYPDQRLITQVNGSVHSRDWNVHASHFNHCPQRTGTDR
ncbi:hypothetical protein, partial [Stenotrophomonas sp. P5_B8]